MFFVVRRATLLIPSGPANDAIRKHLFICITDPVGEDQDTLLVSVSTLRPGEPADTTCRLFPGDHPFIRHESYVQYCFARVEPADNLMKAVNAGLFIPQDALESGVFARVYRGFFESRHVAPGMLKFLDGAGSLP